MAAATLLILAFVIAFMLLLWAKASMWACIIGSVLFSVALVATLAAFAFKFGSDNAYVMVCGAESRSLRRSGASKW